jgi:hypothetical protein
MTGLRFTTARGLLRMARCTTIADRTTSQREMWRVNDEQVELLNVIEAHAHVFAAKPRKVGFSTAGSFATLQEMGEASTRGERMRAVFAIDKDDKALEHLERAEDWADQWKIRVSVKRSPPRALVFRSGAHYDFLTMGSDEPGRGGDIDRLQITELPYAAHPERAYHSLRSACTDKAPILIETTLTTLDPFVASFWRGARRDPVTRVVVPLGTEFHRHMSFVENQKSYRLPMVSV